MRKKIQQNSCNQKNSYLILILVGLILVHNHVTNGGNMKRFRYLIFSLLFVLFAVMPPVFAQEEAAEPEAVVEEAVVEEAVVEEEAVWGDEAAAEEVAPAETAKAPGSGYQVSLGVGMGLVTGEYITKAPTGFGLVVGLPFSMPIGPLDISVSAAVLMNTMDAGAEEGLSITQIMVFGMAAVPDMPFALMGGGGIAGSGLVIVGGLGVPVNAFVPDLPVNIMVGVNGNLLTALDDNIEGSTYYVSGFVMVGTSF